MGRVLGSTAVTASAALMVLGALAGFGVIGTRVEDSSGGVFATGQTLLTPGGPAFSIWSLIYLGLLAYVVWQWLPGRSERVQAIAGYASVSMLLNAAWLAVTQAGLVWLSVVIILALAVDLGLLMRSLNASAPGGGAERVLVDVTFGVYLGWVCVAALANVTAALVGSGIDPGGWPAELMAVLVLGAATALGAWLAFSLRGRWSVALAMTWALGWIALARLAGDPASVATGVAAIVAAAAILGLTARARRPVAAASIRPVVDEARL